MEGIQINLISIILLTFCQISSPQLRPIVIGRFRSFAHNVGSGDVVILDQKTVEINQFNYDGFGPAGWFVVGRGGGYDQERVVFQSYTVVPDENFGCAKIKQYNRRTIQLTLPGDLTFNDVDFLSVYCLEFQHNFGAVAIPKHLSFPRAAPNNLEECRTRYNSNFSPAAVPGRTSFRDVIGGLFQNLFGLSR